MIKINISYKIVCAAGEDSDQPVHQAFQSEYIYTYTFILLSFLLIQNECWQAHIVDTHQKCLIRFATRGDLKGVHDIFSWRMTFFFHEEVKYLVLYVFCSSVYMGILISGNSPTAMA